MASVSFVKISRSLRQFAQLVDFPGAALEAKLAVSWVEKVVRSGTYERRGGYVLYFLHGVLLGDARGTTIHMGYWTICRN